MIQRLLKWIPVIKTYSRNMTNLNQCRIQLDNMLVTLQEYLNNKPADQWITLMIVSRMKRPRVETSYQLNHSFSIYSSEQNRNKIITLDRV